MTEQNPPIDVPVVEPPTTALTVSEKGLGQYIPPEAKAPVTAAQAKIEAIANLTQSAYAKASELRLTPEETDALKADFPDEAFRTGAAGKEDLIYLEHSALRNRLTNVLGMGQWTMVPRSRWAEDYEYIKNGHAEKASRVYVEAMLIIRGCFVAESIGDMTYYPKNQQTNYGDAVEGAESESLRRCCKKLGVGLQPWSKTFCESWWKRRRTAPVTRPTPTPVSIKQTASASATAPKQAAPAKEPKTFTERMEACKTALLKELSGDAQAEAWEFFRKEGWIMDNEELDAAPHYQLFPSPNPKLSWEENKVLVKQDHDNLLRAILGNVPGANKPEPDPPPTDSLKVTGLIEHVTEKSGTKKDGTPWTSYGVKMGEFWYNTFSKTDGTQAKALKGAHATIYFEETDRGRNLLSIEA